MIKNLNQLLKDKKFQLILPKQIEYEFIRNKNSKSAIYNDHILTFERGLDVKFKTPHLIKSTRLIVQIKSVVEKLNDLKKKAVEDYKSRVFSPNSKINKEMKTLFSCAQRPTETDVILQSARFRTLRGNPPRKDNSSFGDAIIWETILDQCCGSDLVFISGDGDFESEINKGELHELLLEDWSQKTDKKIRLYTKLSSFINDNIKDKKKQIKKETIQEEDWLNSFSSAISADKINYSGMAINKEPSLDFFNNQDIVSSVWKANKTSCSCCAAEIGVFDSGGVLNFSGRCENCKDIFSVGKNCSKCGKHFHVGGLSISKSTYFLSGMCEECQNKSMFNPGYDLKF
jgi:hypothetical protein